MTSAPAMLNTYPGNLEDVGDVDRRGLLRCIDVLLECTQACTACADACLREPTVAELAKCVRLNLDCADICNTTVRVLSRHTGYDKNLTRSIVEACAQACRSCGDECEHHAQRYEYCRVCTDVCRRCETECHQLLTSIG